jgi:hypothetical protein
MTRHRRTQIVVTAIVVLVLLGLGAVMVRSVRRPRTVEASAERERRVAALDAPRLDVRLRSQLPPRPIVDESLPPGAKRLPDSATAVSLARTTVDDYRQRARYPRWSQPLAEGEDPLLRDRTVSPVTSAGPDGAEPTLTVFPDQVSFESPRSVLLYAYLSAGGQRIAADSIRGSVVSEAEQPIGEIVYNDEGRDGDQVAGDYVYTARISADAGLPDVTASYLVKVRAVTLEQQERLGAGGFQYSKPDAQLTGSYRDSRDGGDLAIDAELDVVETGRFHLEATLYSQDGQHPIAWAQQASELTPGRQWLRLRFHGLILHERAINGPYLLRFAALATATQMPNAKNQLVENAYVTGRYDAASFTDQPFNDPDLLEAADRIENAIQGLSAGAGG